MWFGAFAQMEVELNLCQCFYQIRRRLLVLWLSCATSCTLSSYPPAAIRPPDVPACRHLRCEWRRLRRNEKCHTKKGKVMKGQGRAHRDRIRNVLTQGDFSHRCTLFDFLEHLVNPFSWLLRPFQRWKFLNLRKGMPLLSHNSCDFSKLFTALIRFVIVCQ